jgi:uncharacterized phage protein (TIGR02218 family)
MELYPDCGDSGMKAIPADLNTHFSQEVTTICTCWKATLKSGLVLGFTDYHDELVIDGVTYMAMAGYTASAIETTDDLSVDNLDLEGAIMSPSITEADVLAGKWDHAEIEIFEVNYLDLTAGKNILRHGRLGELTLKDGIFVAELRGLMQALQQVIGELYSASCRAELGDARCTKDVTEYTASGTVSTATSTAVFTTNLGSSTVRLTPTTTGAPTDSYFQHGKITWISGANVGLSMEVKDYVSATQQVTLKLGMPYALEIGDTFSILSGCNKSARAAGGCKVKFGNLINFQGEPDLPGIDKMLDVGGR